MPGLRIFPRKGLTSRLRHGILNLTIQLTEVEYHMEYGPLYADRLGESVRAVGSFFMQNEPDKL